ncbi:MAG: PEP-CTERM sorting domain-containing protein [Pirellulaceae bacterium]
MSIEGRNVGLCGKWHLLVLVIVCIHLISTSQVFAGWAEQVVRYDPGSTPAPGFSDPTAALGQPTRFTGVGIFPAAVQPFNPPWLGSELVSLGEGAELVLRLSHFAIPDPDGPELGLFANAGLLDADNDFANPGATASGLPVQQFGVDTVIVDVSANGSDWVALGEIVADVPTLGYLDVVDVTAQNPGDLLTDFSLPFGFSVNDFAGLPLASDQGASILSLYGDSGGGTWIDISDTGLSKVGYLRFRVADDGDVATALNFELDAVTISHVAVGSVVPEPATIVMYFLGLVWLGIRRTANIDQMYL